MSDRQSWAYGDPAHHQHQHLMQHLLQQYQQQYQQQQYSQQGSEEEEDFFTESTSDLVAHSPSANNPDPNDGYYAIGLDSAHYSQGRQRPRQEHQASNSGPEGLALPSHRIRPPDNNGFPAETFNQDINALFSQSQQVQPNFPNGAQIYFQLQQPSPEASHNLQLEGTVPQLNPQFNPQADPEAPPWNPATLRTPPQRGARETFVPRVDQRNIDPRILQQAQAQFPGRPQPSSPATTQADYAPPVTPSNDDRVSIGQRSDASRSRICPTCGTPFGDRRTRKRHEREVHNEGAVPPYACPCGRKTIRVWNHDRHMASCRRREDSRNPYVCRCGEQHFEHQLHLDHTKDCGKQTAGRRPRAQDIANNNQLWLRL